MRTDFLHNFFFNLELIAASNFVPEKSVIWSLSWLIIFRPEVGYPKEPFEWGLPALQI